MPFYGEERISVYEAVKAYTWGPAYAACDERIRGSIEVGKKADLVVLSKDIFNVATDEIKDIKAITTVVDGKVVYGETMV